MRSRVGQSKLADLGGELAGLGGQLAHPSGGLADLGGELADLGGELAYPSGQLAHPSGPGPRKDTVLVLPGQVLDIDFVADNPGDWMLHCHNAYHAQAGMMTTLSYLD
ncbi:multicopper oxidase domain-containing protein [Saccharomonospora sp. NPDC046836]|uniref:multicopper oxidase domain-containing protein n=1 Tax=Saccharomonospora sp. NPDC046836 TaxID=3156921 RepID=UPI0033C4D304